MSAAVREVAETARKLGYARAKVDRLQRALREIDVRWSCYDDLDRFMRDVRPDLYDDPGHEVVAPVDKESESSSGE